VADRRRFAIEYDALEKVPPARRFLVAAGLEQIVEAQIVESQLSGLDATATVEAGRRFGIPLSGTMGHSFIETQAPALCRPPSPQGVAGQGTWPVAKQVFRALVSPTP
jgi:hypothetical protein